MSKPFDATLNILIDRHLKNWVTFLCDQADLTFGEPTSIDTDLSITSQADKLIRVEASEPYLLHLEIETSGALEMPSRLLHYHVNAERVHKLPIWSIVLLLRPSGNPSDLTGIYDRRFFQKDCLTFRYTVISIWKLRFEMLLNSGPGLIPLSMLTNEAVSDKEACLSQVYERLREESTSSKMLEDDMSSIYFLMGLRHDRDILRNLFREFAMTLEESSTYQDVLEQGRNLGYLAGRNEGRDEGRNEGVAMGEIQKLRVSILRLGTKRLGAIPEDLAAKIQAESDTPRLDAMLERVLDAKTWAEILSD
ncbi:MAG: hypothetical protein ACRC8S_11360 [Fimbriiglobus sp.]